MGQISLKKIVSKRETLSVIQDILNAVGSPVRIQDADGRILINTESENLSDKYPIEVAGVAIGWVMGEEKALAIASLLSYIAKQESEKKSLAHELLEKYQEIDLFHDISTQITASLDLREVAKLVIEEAGKLIEFTSGVILLLNQKTGQLERISEFGQTRYIQKPLRLGEGLVGSIIQAGKGEIVNDVSLDSRFIKSHEPVSSLICVPMKTKEQIIGAIAVFSETPETYSAGDLKLLNMFASQAAVAIQKALLYEQSRTALLVAQDRAQQLQQTLCELQQTQAQLIQSEKMSSLGQLVAGVAHEINNPVNFIYGNLNHAHQYFQDMLGLLELYEQHYPKPPEEIADAIENVDMEFLKQDFSKLIDSMKVGGDRIRQIVSSLQNFSRLDQSSMKPVNVHEGIDSTLSILQHRLKATAKNSPIQIVKEYANLPKVECYASQLNQVFMNIINNAIDALEFQGEPRIVTIRTELGTGKWGLGSRNREFPIPNSQSPLPAFIVIRISDNGTGMSEAVKKQIFDPFFTTKPVGKGTGLGLSISYHIVVEKHGGLLKCISKPGEGTEFAIEIPVKPAYRSHSESQGHLETERALSIVR